MRPESKSAEEKCSWILRRVYHYNTLSLQVAIKKGLDISLLKKYLDCLERNENGTQFSRILIEKYQFNAVFLWVAFKNSPSIIDVLKEYIDCLEAKNAPKQTAEAERGNGKCVAILALILMFFLASGDAMACHQPSITTACYRPKTICYGFVRHLVKERRGGRWHYHVREVLTELPCPHR
jgi:hypothetical protein